MKKVGIYILVLTIVCCFGLGQQVGDSAYEAEYQEYLTWKAKLDFQKEKLKSEKSTANCYWSVLGAASLFWIVTGEEIGPVLFGTGFWAAIVAWDYFPAAKKINKKITELELIGRQNNWLNGPPRIDDPKRNEIDSGKIEVDDIETKLKKLKSLHENGLISEDEYNKKRSELLEKL